MKTHIHTLIGKFVRDYRRDIDQLLENGKTSIAMRKHWVAGNYIAGQIDSDFHEDDKPPLEHIEFEGLNTLAVATYVNATDILSELYKNLRKGKTLDNIPFYNTSFLELRRAVSEIEFLLNDDLHYKIDMQAAA